MRELLAYDIQGMHIHDIVVSEYEGRLVSLQEFASVFRGLEYDGNDLTESTHGMTRVHECHATLV